MVDPIRVDQVNAAAFCARDRLSCAAAESEPTRRAKLLTVAAEYALRSVTLAWGAPSSKSERLWAFFDEHLASLLSEDTARRTGALRPGAEGEAPTADQASADIAAVIELGVAGPPQGWSAPVRDRLGWSNLGAVEREVLCDAWRTVTTILPDAELWLFGSRATGEAEADSDYDLALIYPDVTQERLVSLAMGELWSLGRHRGVQLDRQRITASSFADPTDQDRALVSQVTAFGFPVPPPAEAEPAR